MDWQRIRENDTRIVALFSFEGTSKEKSGDDSKEDPPVPMPNTEVKLFHVDDTWRETARESRQLPELIFLYSSVGRAHDC